MDPFLPYLRLHCHRPIPLLDRRRRIKGEGSLCIVHSRYCFDSSTMNRYFHPIRIGRTAAVPSFAADRCVRFGTRPLGSGQLLGRADNDIRRRFNLASSSSPCPETTLQNRTSGGRCERSQPRFSQLSLPSSLPRHRGHGRPRDFSTGTHRHRRTLNKRDFAYCVDLVQNRDRESYVCGLLMPHEARKAYFAIRAFNVELSSVKDGGVGRRAGGGAQSADDDAFGGGESPPLALKVRMQWWREAVNQIYDERSDEEKADAMSVKDGDSQDAIFSKSMAASYFKNPVVRVLDYAVQEKQLTRRFLERLFEAREADLDNRQPETVEETVQYADNIFSSLLYLSLETADVREGAADVVAQHAGIGLGLVTALRGARFRLCRGEFPIPRDLIAPGFPYHKLYSLVDHIDEGRDPSEVGWADEEKQMLKDAVEQLAALAYSHLDRARDLQSDIPRHARPCLLPVVPALHYMSRLEKADYDIFDDALLEQHHLTVLGSLGLAWLTRVF